MKYFFYFFFFIVLLTSCFKESPITSVETDSEVSGSHTLEAPIGPQYPVSDVDKVFTVKIEDTNYNSAQKAKLALAEVLIANIFNSSEFKGEVLLAKFTNTKGLTNREIFDKIFVGAEDLLPAQNYQMDLKVTMYYKRVTRVIGYTMPSSLVINTNLKFHNSFTPCQIASNICHEDMHKIGFDHTSAAESTSVPYSIGSIVLKLCTTLP